MRYDPEIYSVPCLLDFLACRYPSIDGSWTTVIRYGAIFCFIYFLTVVDLEILGDMLLFCLLIKYYRFMLSATYLRCQELGKIPVCMWWRTMACSSSPITSLAFSPWYLWNIRWTSKKYQLWNRKTLLVWLSWVLYPDLENVAGGFFFLVRLLYRSRKCC